MLQSYSLEGYKSIKNRIDIDLKKTQYQILEKTNVESGILKGCMFVGGNASGKTNLLEGLYFLMNILFFKGDILWDDYVCLFSDSGVLENSYDFIVDGISVHYEIRYQKNDTLLMERLSVDSRLVMERIGSTAKSELTERKNFTDVPLDSIFLRDLWFNTKFRGNRILQRWYEFLQNSKYVNPQGHYIIAQNMKNIITINRYVQENGVEELNSFLEECGFLYTLVYRPEERQEGNAFSGLYIYRHEVGQEIPLSVESLGNKTLMLILPAYLSVVKHGGMLVCDEFSSGLHNDLEELLVKYFMKHTTGGQIFIVSHSTNLLSSSLFRPDQLYAVNFDQEGTNIVRFSSEQPRTGQNYEKMYLGGVFSGLPRYREI